MRYKECNSVREKLEKESRIELRMDYKFEKYYVGFRPDLHFACCIYRRTFSNLDKRRTNEFHFIVFNLKRRCISNFTVLQKNLWRIKNVEVFGFFNRHGR